MNFHPVLMPSYMRNIVNFSFKLYSSTHDKRDKLSSIFRCWISPQSFSYINCHLSRSLSATNANRNASHVMRCVILINQASPLLVLSLIFSTSRFQKEIFSTAQFCDFVTFDEIDGSNYSLTKHRLNKIILIYRIFIISAAGYRQYCLICINHTNRNVNIIFFYNNRINLKTNNY